MADEITKYDLGGYDAVTRALWDLLNSYPDLNGDEFMFAEVDAASGKAFIPISGAKIQSETRDVTEHVTQYCLYPFMLVYKAAGLSENNKVNVKEWLEKIGRWLGKETVTIKGLEQHLTEYPELTGDREIVRIECTSPSYLASVNQENVEQWEIMLQAVYKNEYDE